MSRFAGQKRARKRKCRVPACQHFHAGKNEGSSTPQTFNNTKEGKGGSQLMTRVQIPMDAKLFFLKKEKFYQKKAL